MFFYKVVRLFRPFSSCIFSLQKRSVIKWIFYGKLHAWLLTQLCFPLITKTRLYNFDPLKPQFYIVKLGFTGVYIIFLILLKKHRLWILVRTVLTSTHNLCFEQECGKYQNFLSENFPFWVVKFSIYLNRYVFVMSNCKTVSRT